ncbi:MAG: hypothetical protein UMR38_00015 [Candidatus Izemoplasma sp.]|nr:hypothetical protein [Candidatus Izemoplasma sp.]
MKPRALYTERIKYNSNGFELVRFYEDGNVTHQKFVHDDHGYSSFHTTESNTYEVDGNIILQEVHFDDENKRLNTELSDHIKVLDTFSKEEYEKAHKKLMALHKETHEDLSVDYRLVFELDLQNLDKGIPVPREVKTYPITYFRATTNIKEIERKKDPENLAIRFIPTMNESLYFHYIPNNDHITMTGDNLFALDTRQLDNKLSEQEFVDYVDKMVEDVKDNTDYYQSLIKSQRNRRASLETDEMGDLYPR